jgi:hypothetical protein
MEEITQKKTLEHLEAERFEWSLETFPEATTHSSLQKLKQEILEVKAELRSIKTITGPHPELAEEYADCLMCLFDSAGRSCITTEMLRDAFEKKLAINKARSWVNNGDNTYSHVKEVENG